MAAAADQIKQDEKATDLGQVDASVNQEADDTTTKGPMLPPIVHQPPPTTTSATTTTTTEGLMQPPSPQQQQPQQQQQPLQTYAMQQQQPQQPQTQSQVQPQVQQQPPPPPTPPQQPPQNASLPIPAQQPQYDPQPLHPQQQPQPQPPQQPPQPPQQQLQQQTQPPHYAQPQPQSQQHQQQQQPPQPTYDIPQQQQQQQQQPQPQQSIPPPQQQQQQQHQQHQQHQQQPQQQPAYDLPPPQVNGAPPGYAPAQQIPPPHHNPYQYQQSQYPQPPVNGDTNGFPAQMRYSMPLPPNQMNQQQLSGTRHKKEIKRRTKTGCLTCRKRRIKCDEGHPSCRNCQKSKRECLGYDPIFKTQTGQPALQPLPGSAPPPPDSHSPHPPPPLAQPQYSNVPQGYVPASSAGYAPAPAMQNQMEQAYDYANAIDPALAVAHPGVQQPPPLPPPQQEYTTILLPERNVRLITMEHVYHLDGIPPSYPPPQDFSTQPIPQHDMDGVRDLYLREYAPGLDRFFETDWYTTAGLNALLSDQDLLHYFAHCLERFRHPPSENNKGLPSIEARLVWLLTSMAFSQSAVSPVPLNFLPRIEAVSHVILGTFMSPERVPPAPTVMPDPKNQPDDYAFYLQDLFWHHLSSFSTIRDDASRQPNSGQEIANHLAGMRNILSMLENRDVLYSMAIARHFGGRMERYDPDKVLVGRGPESEDPINKLVVAMGFLANEEIQGTTQVVQRLCGMSRRGFQLQRSDYGEVQQTPIEPKQENGSLPPP